MNRNDRLLLGAILLLSCALYAFFAMQPAGAAASVRLSVDGALLETWSADASVEHTWRAGEDYVLVRIEDGRAQIVSSSCPDQWCVRQGAISQAGESIVCLPNRLVVSLSSEAPGASLDAVIG